MHIKKKKKKSAPPRDSHRYQVMVTIYSQEQVIYKFLATRIYKFIGWRAGGRHFEEVGLVNLGVSSGELSFSKSNLVDTRGHHDVGLTVLTN